MRGGGSRRPGPRHVRRGVLVALGVGVLVVVGSALAATFSNTNAITIADSATPPTTASSYPSQIVVSGEQTVTDLNVTLTGLTHNFGDDIDILLVGPLGQTVVLMSDAIGDVASNLTLTFDDEAAAMLPDEDPAASGSYKPTNYSRSSIDACPTEPDPDVWPTAPASPYGQTLSVFDGTNPNGTWKLYIVDDCAGDAGSLAGGWSLTFAQPTVVVLASFSARTQGKKVVVRWRSASEPDLLGFNVYRSAAGKLKKLNRVLIRAKGGSAGHSYSFLDKSARPGRSYGYRLQSVSTGGKRAWLARASVRP